MRWVPLDDGVGGVGLLPAYVGMATESGQPCGGARHAGKAGAGPRGSDRGNAENLSRPILGMGVTGSRWARKGRNRTDVLYTSPGCQPLTLLWGCLLYTSPSPRD